MLLWPEIFRVKYGAFSGSAKNMVHKSPVFRPKDFDENYHFWSSKSISDLSFERLHMELKKNLLLIVCIFVSLAGLVFIYFSLTNTLPPELKISKIDPSLNGKLISTTGKITYVRTHTAGHIFLTLSDGDSKIEVPLFSSLVNHLSSNGITKYDFRKGKTIRVTGIVGEYKDQLQIVPRKATDIQFPDSLK